MIILAKLFRADLAEAVFSWQHTFMPRQTRIWHEFATNMSKQHQNSHFEHLLTENMSIFLENCPLSIFWPKTCKFTHNRDFWAWNYQKRALRSLDRISLEGFVSSWAIKRRKHRQAPTIITTFEWFCVELSNEMPDLLLSYNSEQRRVNQQNRFKLALNKKTQRSQNQADTLLAEHPLY